MAQQLNIEHAKNVYYANGLELLEDVYVNNCTKMKTLCQKCGYTWLTSLVKIKIGRGCPRCHKCLKYTLADAQKIAELKGGKCLSRQYSDKHSKLEFECALGHRWFATLHHVQRDTWCPVCGGSLQKTIKDCQDLALQNGGKCLSDSYINAFKKLSWKCSIGHIWETTYASVYVGSWCPECSGRKTQKLLSKVMRSIFPNFTIKYNYRMFDWLISDCGKKQEIDIYIPELKLGIEYDGQQHFMPVRFNGIAQQKAEENFKKLQALDKNKNDKIAKHKEDVQMLIRFNYSEEITEHYVREKLLLSGVKINE